MLDKESLLHEIKERIKGLQLRIEKFRKSRDGSQLNKTVARVDELKRLKGYIENGLFDIESVEDDY